MVGTTVALINWADYYSVKVKEMDEQHKKLIQLINDFYNAYQSGTTEEVPALMEGVIKYTKVHFSREEKLIKQHGFPEYDSHKAEHDDFAKKAIAMNQKYISGDKSIAGEMAVVLSNWLTNHIVINDKKYGVYLNSKGVT
jgi:hemerythrin